MYKIGRSDFIPNRDVITTRRIVGSGFPFVLHASPLRTHHSSLFSRPKSPPILEIPPLWFPETLSFTRTSHSRKVGTVGKGERRVTDKGTRLRSVHGSGWKNGVGTPRRDGDERSKVDGSETTREQESLMTVSHDSFGRVLTRRMCDRKLWCQK